MAKQRDSTAEITVVIGDDHALVRAGLRAALEIEPGLQVVGEAADCDSALALVIRLKPDLLLADILMPGGDGIELARAVRQLQPATKVLIVSLLEGRQLQEEALAAGAGGYVSKRTVDRELVAAVRTVADGRLYVSNGQPGPARSRPLRRLDLSLLTDDELELFRLLAQGYSSAQIAREFALDDPEIRRRRSVLDEKLQSPSRVELVHSALEHGIL